ncbi:MAG: NYN domain-containing protein [bacterium]
MAKNKENLPNNAYIDGANLHKGIEDLGWSLDYGKFRIWLREKYRVSKVYLFIGLVPKYKAFYTHLQEAGFTLVFKETTYSGKGEVKGNCDADLVLSAVKDAYENTFEKAVVVAGDGDYASLVSFLGEKRKLKVVLAPNYKKCSILLKRTGVKITYLNQFKSRLRLVRK